MILKVTPSKFQVEDWFAHVVVGMFVFQCIFFDRPLSKGFCPATEQRHNLPCQKGYPTRVALDKRAMGGGGKEEKEKEKRNSWQKEKAKNPWQKDQQKQQDPWQKDQQEKAKDPWQKDQQKELIPRAKLGVSTTSGGQAGSGTVSHKRREKYRLRQRNREEMNAKGIRTPSQERAALEKERREKEEEEQWKEEEALAFLNKRKMQRDEAALHRRNQEEEKKKKEQEAALDKSSL